MPQIFEFKCNKCEFKMPRGWGGVMYVKNNEGKKIVCPHPAEAFTIAETLKIDERDVFAWLLGEFDKLSKETKELIDEKTGFDSYCVCLDCLNQFKMDLKREKRICPKCASRSIKTESEMVGKACPKCKKGTIESIDTGIIS